MKIGLQISEICNRCNMTDRLINIRQLYYSLGSLPCTVYVGSKDPVYLDKRPLPSSAWASWKDFESGVEVEAAKDEVYRRPMVRAIQLSSEMYASCRGGELRWNVLYRLRSPDFQIAVRVKPLVLLTSLCWVQRPCITRRWTPVDFFCLGPPWADWNSGGDGSCKGCAVQPA